MLFLQVEKVFVFHIHVKKKYDDDVSSSSWCCLEIHVLPGEEDFDTRYYDHKSYGNIIWMLAWICCKTGIWEAVG